MAMEDWKSVFSRIFWKNKRAGGTPLNEVNLNIGDIAMQEFDNRILELRDAKFGRAEANGLIKDWKIDEKTGIITVTWLNGTTKIYDLNIEKIPVNFEMSDDGIITMTTDDGTKFKTDIKKAIPIYTFKGSATIKVTPSIGKSGDKAYTFEIVDGSIDGTKLDPDYLAQINTSVGNASNYAESAQTSATAAATSELNAKKSEINAKKSETAAMTSETNAQASETAAASSVSTATTKASEASASATNAANSANSASASASTAASKASSASSSATTATTKANEASASAASAATSATNAKTSENNAQAYAVGAINSAKYYYEQSKAISESFSGALRPMGTVAFASLPTLASASEGDMYNVSNQFTTTADFKEGSGFIIPAGANVYKTSDGKWDILAGTPVTGVKGNKETTYRRGNVNITPENIGLGNVGDFKAVSTVASQGLTDTEKSNARANIGAGTSSFSGNYNDLSNKPTIPAAVAVKGNAESSYRTGNVNLTPANIGALAINGDSKSNTVTFTSNDVDDASATSWTSVSKLATGITHATFFQRVSQMFKNVRYLYKMLGTTDISGIGNGTVTGGLSTLNSNLDTPINTAIDFNTLTKSGKYTINVAGCPNNPTPGNGGQLFVGRVNNNIRQTYINDLGKVYSRIGNDEWVEDLKSSKSPISIDSFNEVEYSGGIIKIKSNNCGVVFRNILYAKKIKFTLHNDVYCQYGVCKIGATMPNIISTGEGRESFDATTTKGIYEITVNGTTGNFFIGGNSGAIITDVQVSELL